MFDDELNNTQKIIGFTFFALLFITIVINLLIHIINSTSWLNLSFFINAISLILIFVFSLINKQAIRYFQCAVFFLQGYASFILDTPNNFWGWGLCFVGLMLLTYYGFWKDKFLHKVAFIVFISFIVTIISAYVNENVNLILSTVIYSVFIVLFVGIIYRRSLCRLFFDKNNLTAFKEQIKEKEAEIIELKEKLVSNKNEFSSLEDIHNILDRTQIEILNIKSMLGINPQEVLELKNELEQIRQKAKKLELEKLQSKIADADISIITIEEIERILTECSSFGCLSMLEKRLISVFYKSRGVATNVDLAYALDLSESSIKNTFSSIYKKLNIPSRSALISFIDDQFRNMHKN